MVGGGVEASWACRWWGTASGALGRRTGTHGRQAPGGIGLLLGVGKRERGQKRCRVRRRGARPVGDGLLHGAARRHGHSGRVSNVDDQRSARGDPFPVLAAGMEPWGAGK